MSATAEDYAVLGIKRTATKKTVIQAYRRMAVLLHPDKNKGNEADFLKVKESYERIMKGDGEIQSPMSAGLETQPSGTYDPPFVWYSARDKLYTGGISLDDAFSDRNSTASNLFDELNSDYDLFMKRKEMELEEKRNVV